MKIKNINIHSKVEEGLFHLAIGNFDGVHLGHQQIISTLVKVANEQNKLPAILSFNPHPKQFFSKQLNFYQILSEEKKQSIFKRLGIKHYFSLNFDETIAELSPSDFVSEIIVKKLKVEKLIVGYDFHFGKKRKGNTALLLNYAKIFGFTIDIIQPIYEKKSNEIFSSTIIREAIRNGDMEKAKTIMGRFWSMSGEVLSGDKKAREMNFPTANILPHKQIHPQKGVYVVKVKFNGKYINGIANFGDRPTVDGNRLLLEVHLFDFNQDIYGNYLTVEFLTFIREEKKFDSFAKLAEQIKKDTQIAKNYHLSK